MSLATSLDSDGFKYTSYRTPVLARNGVVATSSPLAAQAGLQMLLKGGNAIDAALAAATALTVLQPWVNGIGSDLFAMVWDGSKLHGLNGSGRAPAAHTPELFAQRELTQMPSNGWLTVTVPGAPAAWRDLHERFGKLPFRDLFEPAIAYAEEGWPLEPETARAWATAQRTYPDTRVGPEFSGWYEAFAPDRQAQAGDIWALPDHARSLRLIADTKAAAFYKGELASEMAAFAAKTDGHLTRADLEAHTSTWVDPICVPYRGYEVWEMPPNTQAIASLQALALLEGFDLAAHPRESVESYHLQIEAMKVAFADTRAYVADPEFADVPVRGMLDPDYVRQRRGLIGDVAHLPVAGEPPRGGTVYLCTADASGMMVSLIQSNYQGFGSGVVVPGTGISFQNRGRGFSLEPGHPNEIGPGKRPFHTLMPGFLSQGGRPIGPFGVMGAPMQPQGHVQMIVNQIDYAMNPQASLDAPRWRWVQGLEVQLEREVPAEVVEGLTRRGHEIRVRENGPLVNAEFGRGQIIRRLPNGAYLAGSDPRADGCAAAY